MDSTIIESSPVIDLDSHQRSEHELLEPELNGINELHSMSPAEMSTSPSAFDFDPRVLHEILKYQNERITQLEKLLIGNLSIVKEKHFDPQKSVLHRLDSLDNEYETIANSVLDCFDDPQEVHDLGLLECVKKEMAKTITDNTSDLSEEIRKSIKVDLLDEVHDMIEDRIKEVEDVVEDIKKQTTTNNNANSDPAKTPIATQATAPSDRQTLSQPGCNITSAQLTMLDQEVRRVDVSSKKRKFSESMNVSQLDININNQLSSSTSDNHKMAISNADIQKALSSRLSSNTSNCDTIQSDKIDTLQNGIQEFIKNQDTKGKDIDEKITQNTNKIQGLLDFVVNTKTILSEYDDKMDKVHEKLSLLIDDWLKPTLMHVKLPTVKNNEVCPIAFKVESFRLNNTLFNYFIPFFMKTIQQQMETLLYKVREEFQTQFNDSFTTLQNTMKTMFSGQNRNSSGSSGLDTGLDTYRLDMSPEEIIQTQITQSKKTMAGGSMSRPPSYPHISPNSQGSNSPNTNLQGGIKQTLTPQQINMQIKHQQLQQQQQQHQQLLSEMHQNSIHNSKHQMPQNLAEAPTAKSLSGPTQFPNPLLTAANLGGVAGVHKAGLAGPLGVHQLPPPMMPTGLAAITGQRTPIAQGLNGQLLSGVVGTPSQLGGLPQPIPLAGVEIRPGAQGHGPAVSLALSSQNSTGINSFNNSPVGNQLPSSGSSGAAPIVPSTAARVSLGGLPNPHQQAHLLRPNYHAAQVAHAAALAAQHKTNPMPLVQFAGRLPGQGPQPGQSTNNNNNNIGQQPHISPHISPEQAQLLHNNIKLNIAMKAPKQPKRGKGNVEGTSSKKPQERDGNK